MFIIDGHRKAHTISLTSCLPSSKTVSCEKSHSALTKIMWGLFKENHHAIALKLFLDPKDPFRIFFHNDLEKLGDIVKNCINRCILHSDYL